jgi:hypothetical protein
MDTQFSEYFISCWNKYFPDTGLPIGFYYTDQVHDEDVRTSVNENRCLIGNLNRVRDGYPFMYNAATTGCSGGKRYSGFSQNLRPKFEYFLSCGIPGEMEGERYKQSPTLVEEYLKQHPPFHAPGTYLVFKRWDKFRSDEQPLAVIFFATADVLAGLFTLANFDVAHPNGVITPMGAGCASIINYPLEEANADSPRCILGMFDVSARPHLPKDTFTFAVPMKRFVQMARNMDESFLVTESWHEVKKRL